VYYNETNPMPWPLPYSVLLRVHDSDACAPIDSDPHRAMWWAEIRRHVPDETALSVASVAAKNLPTGLTRASLALTGSVSAGCSAIAFLPAGSGKSGAKALQLAPLDAEGMPAYVAWSGSTLRTQCKVRNSLGEAVTLFWVDDTIEERKLLEVPANGEVPQHTFVGHVFVARLSAPGDKARQRRAY